MICPQCQTELPDDARFCNECGRKLESVCSECGKGNPPTSKFCLECGHDLRTPPAASPLKDLSFDEKLANIQKYLPSGLTEKVLSQRGRIEGERRQVTIMFVDMKGFTPLTEKLGPEETFTLMDQVFELMIHKVHDYEGTVNELRGDGMLAFFGAPIALEDAPQRAIRSSLAIHREMTKFSDKLKDRTDIPPVQLRIGINTGPVVVGTLGNDLRVQFTAVGDTINMAARMEQLAEPGTTYVTEDAFKITEGYFRFEALGEKEVKGKEQPIKVYRVIAPSTRKTRFDVSAERGLTRFVGRERELEIMLDAFERAKAGRGQAVSIVGEAGVGKSRLLYEFRKAVANEDVTFLEGKCLSYGRNVSYHPIIDILNANFDLGEGDEDKDVREKVTHGLKALGVDESATLPYLLELLSVKNSGIDKIQMSPEGKRDRVVEAIKGISLKGSEIRPLIIAIEDLHWIDKNSEDVSKYLLENVPGARVLLLFTYRPEFVHTWGGRSFHSQVTLNRLSNRESLAMVAHFLGTENIPTDLEDLILEKTEGVPFFLEEFVKSLMDLKIIERKDQEYHLAQAGAALTIPSTIQDMIMPRVDGLPEGPKQVLQTGSVIEREFSYELINAVTHIPEPELLSHLSALKNSELLYERGVHPESTFVFRHALTREVVYDSMLAKNREKTHGEIGKAIEDVYKDNIAQYYGILAEHFIRATNYEKGSYYSRLAGKKAAKTASMDDAIAYLKRTLGCLQELPCTDDVQKKIIDARTILGLYYTQKNCHLEAQEAVSPIIDLAEKLNYERRLSEIYTIVGIYFCFVVEEYPKGIRYLDDALKIADMVKEVISLFFANYWLGPALVYHCEFDRGFHHFQKALDINVAANNLWAISAVKSTQSICYPWPGVVNLSYQIGDEALRIAEKSGDMHSKSMASVAYGIGCFCKGLLEEAKTMLVKAVHLCKTTGLLMWEGFAESTLGEACFEMGEYFEARDHHEKAVHVLERSRLLPSWVNLNTIAAARAALCGGEKDLDVKSMYTLVDENKTKIYGGLIRRYVGEILLNIGDQHFSEAQHWIEEAIEADERNGMRFHLGRDYAVYAELFKRKGDRVGAKEQLGKAIEIYRECGADGWVTKAEEELARMS